MSRQGIGGGMQPYKRKGRVGPPGSAAHAMGQGKPAGLANPASLAQALARLARGKRMAGNVTTIGRVPNGRGKRPLRSALRGK